MNKLFATTIAAIVLIPTVAAAETPATHSFTRDGQTYVYTSATMGSRQVIDGYSANTGSRFHLIVRGNAVSGESDGRAVSFRVATTNTIETASR